MTVRDALVAGRECVAHAMGRGALTGPEPDEETLSWVLLSTAAAASDRISVRRFTRYEEKSPYRRRLVVVVGGCPGRMVRVSGAGKAPCTRPHWPYFRLRLPAQTEYSRPRTTGSGATAVGCR